MIRTILTPIDGSVHAQMALELGTDLAAKYDAELIVLHVVTHDDNLPRGLYEEAERELKETQDDSEGSELAAPALLHSKVLEQFGHKLLRSAQDLAKDKGVEQVEVVIDDGAADKRILHHATTRSADLIVMGSRGFGELKALIFGSVSYSVFHRASCSCVTIHHTGEKSAFENIRNILVPTDGSAHADKAVVLASDIAAKYGARLSLVYVTCRGPSLEEYRESIDMSQLSESTRGELEASEHPVAEHVSSALIPPVVSQDALDEIGEQVLARGKETAESKGVAVINTVLIDGDPARKILQVAKTEKADLISMGSRGLGGAEGMLSGSVSYKVNHSANCNCLIVR